MLYGGVTLPVAAGAFGLQQLKRAKKEILAAATDSRIATLPNVPTMGELAPELNLGLWNGLFVTKDTPADVREKIIAVAKETMMSVRAQKLAMKTGAGVYWQGADESAARIAADGEKFGAINGMLE